MSRKRFIDVDELIDGLMVYTWYDEDGFEIDDSDAKREYIEKWLPDIPTVEAITIKWMIEQRDKETVGTHTWWMYQAIMEKWKKEHLVEQCQNYQ